MKIKLTVFVLVLMFGQQCFASDLAVKLYEAHYSCSNACKVTCVTDGSDREFAVVTKSRTELFKRSLGDGAYEYVVTAPELGRGSQVFSVSKGSMCFAQNFVLEKEYLRTVK